MEDSETLRGVNLGGWLILEKWMTPTLFRGTDAIDEFTFMQTDGAADKIEMHRKTFITEEDFRWLSQNGINAVRIPVGYWILSGDGPFTPAIDYLDWAIQMAEKYHLKVLVDLHGLQGSQNGKDHSGRIGKNLWHKTRENRLASLDTLEILAKRYYDSPSVWGIEIINEPKSGYIQWRLRKYYRAAYDRLVQTARPGTVIIYHDGFTPRLLNRAIQPTADFPVMMDIHWYQFGSFWRGWQKVDDYFRTVAGRTRLLKRLSRSQPIIIGEWSVVLTEKILSNMTKAERAEAFRRHGQVQLETYRSAYGWFYWTYKTEGRGIWHFRSLVEDGKIILQ